MPHDDPRKSRKPRAPHPDDGLTSPAAGLPASRRSFLLMTLGVMATGCAQTTKRTATGLPGPEWPDHVGSGSSSRARDLPGADVDPMAPATGGILPRRQWARGAPVPTLMNRMIPIRYITVHHDGMNPFYGDSAAAAAERLELIRRSHRNRNWGDIGYHYIVDRGGRVWEGRPLGYQGAHVKDHNEGNIGVMCLGNFEQQAPTVAQLEGLNGHLTALMRHFRVPVRYVKTHQEWAATACPGRNLQRHMVYVRSSRAIG